MDFRQIDNATIFAGDVLDVIENEQERKRYIFCKPLLAPIMHGRCFLDKGAERKEEIAVAAMGQCKGDRGGVQPRRTARNYCR